MLKAFEMNPTRKETLLGLEGIYYSLQDTEKSETLPPAVRSARARTNDR